MLAAFSKCLPLHVDLSTLSFHVAHISFHIFISTYFLFQLRRTNVRGLHVASYQQGKLAVSPTPHHLGRRSYSRNKVVERKVSLSTFSAEEYQRWHSALAGAKGPYPCDYPFVTRAPCEKRRQMSPIAIKLVCR